MVEFYTTVRVTGRRPRRPTYAALRPGPGSPTSTRCSSISPAWAGRARR